jgi:hypothetical protein
MKHFLLSILAFIIISIFSSATFSDSINWTQPYPSLLTQPISGKSLLYFRADNIVYCQEVEEDVWTDQRIINATRSMQTIWLDAKSPIVQQLATRVGVFVAPTVILVENGAEVSRMERKWDREDYLRFLGLSAHQSIPSPANAYQPTSMAASDVILSSFKEQDSPGDGSPAHLDIREVKVTLTDNEVILDFVMSAIPDVSRIIAYNAFVDLDDNSSTGYVNDWVQGADLLIQGSNISRFNGGANQSNWAWQETGSSNYQVLGTRLQIGVPRDKFLSLKTNRLKAWFSTQNAEWVEVDRAPNGEPLVVNVNNIETSNLPATSNSERSIRYEDVVNDANPNEDIVATEIKQSQDWLLVKVLYSGPPNLNGFHLFFNSDNKLETGFASGTRQGADFMIEGGSLYRHTGEGNAWDWNNLGALTPEVGSNFLNFRIPISRIAYRRDAKISMWFTTTDTEWNDADYLPDRDVITFPR